LILLVALSVIVIPPPTQALAHEGNSSHRSEIRRVQPDIPGLSIEVLNYDDRLLLVNRSGKTAFVRGYDDEPYLRIRSGGAVEVNKRSPTYYLNEDRFAQVDVPAQADEKAPPRWEVVGSSGRYEWHDHRIHWMSKDLPPQVKDEDKATKIFDWNVPLVVGAQRGSVAGTLTWEPSDSGIPTVALIGFGGLALASLFLFLASRRIRTRRHGVRRGGAW